MVEQPNLNLAPIKPKTSNAVSKGPTFLIIVVIILQGIIIASVYKSQTKPPTTAATIDLHKSQLLKNTAIKLEELDLTERAAKVWQQYLALGNEKNTAAVYYRIGKLHQRAKQYEQAIDFFQRAELSAPEKRLQQDISERVVDCLKQLQRFNALSDVLKTKAEIATEEDKATKVVARIGKMEITNTQLDMIIKNEIDTRMQFMKILFPQFAADPEVFRQKMQQQYQTPEGQRQALQEYLFTEVLQRKAIEDGIHKTDSHVEQWHALQRKMLAQNVLQRELNSQVIILPQEIESYYQQNQQEFRFPARAIISPAIFATLAQAQQKLAHIKSELEFKSSSEQEPVPVEITADDREIDELGKVEGLINAVFAKKKTGLLPKVFTAGQQFVLVWVHEVQAAGVHPVSQVKQIIEQKVRQQKTQQIMQIFLESLFQKYDVDIYGSNLPQIKQQNDSPASGKQQE